jgi:hypothetical protein
MKRILPIFIAFCITIPGARALAPTSRSVAINIVTGPQRSLSNPQALPRST